MSPNSIPAASYIASQVMFLSTVDYLCYFIWNRLVCHYLLLFLELQLGLSCQSTSHQRCRLDLKWTLDDRVTTAFQVKRHTAQVYEQETEIRNPKILLCILLDANCVSFEGNCCANLPSWGNYTYDSQILYHWTSEGSLNMIIQCQQVHLQILCWKPNILSNRLFGKEHQKLVSVDSLIIRQVRVRVHIILITFVHE